MASRPRTSAPRGSRALLYVLAVAALCGATPIVSAGAQSLTPAPIAVRSATTPTTTFDLGVAFPTDVEQAPVLPAPQGGGISQFFTLLSLGGFALVLVLLARQWYSSQPTATSSN